MDRLDKISAAAIAVLLLWALGLVVYISHNGLADRAVKDPPKAAGRQYLDPNLTSKVNQVKNLLAAGSLAKAGRLADQLIKAYPFEGMPYMLKGDVLLHEQDPVAAMLQYREAVDLNPDFLDKKTKSFQGKKIKETVDEAQVVIEKGLAGGGVSPTAVKNKKILYYMLRKIAGGCG